MARKQMIFNLKAIRESRGISQDALSKLCNLTVSAVRNYEGGKKKQYAHDIIERFCDVLECTPGELFTLEDKAA